MKKTLLIAFVLVAISWQLVSADVTTSVEKIEFVLTNGTNGENDTSRVKFTGRGVVEESKTFIIAPQQAMCYGPFPRKCLQVKDDPSEDWRFFYGYIDGFDYEPGYEYVLKVDAEDIPNPPIDGSGVKYTLKDQVSKTKA